MVLKQSFYDWCIENNRKDIVDRWDYEKNNVGPRDVGFSSPTPFYFKCPEHLHESSLYKPINISRKNPHAVKLACVYCNSFANYCINNIDENFLEKYWDYEKNDGIDPWTIVYSSKTSIYLRCQQKDYHGSYKTSPSHVVAGNRCPYCSSRKIHPRDSFAQWCIDNVDVDFFDKYWGENNTIDPFTIPRHYRKKLSFKCQNKTYHGEYLSLSGDFVNGVRCPYCGHCQVHILDSLGTMYPEVIKLWSDKNKKSPYEYSIGSNQKVWFKCDSGIHEDYEMYVDRAVERLFHCSLCREETQVSYLQRKIDIHIEQNYPQYTYNHEYNCTIVPRNPKTNRLLPFDRELIIDDKNRLVIECNGLQHYQICLLTRLSAKSSGTTPEEVLAYQKWKDVFKKQCALDNGYYYLEIPYTAEKDDIYKSLIDEKFTSIYNNTKLLNP